MESFSDPSSCPAALPLLFFFARLQHTWSLNRALWIEVGTLARRANSSGINGSFLACSLRGAILERANALAWADVNNVITVSNTIAHTVVRTGR